MLKSKNKQKERESYSAISVSAATLHKTPRSIRHFPLTGSGGDRPIYGGSSKNEIFM